MFGWEAIERGETQGEKNGEPTNLANFRPFDHWTIGTMPSSNLNHLAIVVPLLLLLCLAPTDGRGADNWFREPDGRVLMLRGVNMVNKQAPHDYQAIGFDNRHMEFISRYGFNAVRLGVMWTAVEPAQGDYNQTHIAAMRRTVDDLCSNGIKVLLDVHQDAFTADHGGYGFPLWAAHGQGTESDVGFPLNYFGGDITNISAVVAQDFDHFWANTAGIQDSFQRFLQLIADQLGKAECVLGLEIINEPFPGTDWPLCGTPNPKIPIFHYNFTDGCKHFDQDVYTPFVQRSIDSIHQVNEDLRVLFGPNTLSGLGAEVHLGELSNPKGEVAFSYHNYYNYKRIFADAAKQETRYGIPSLMTEFGANVNVSNWIEVVELADQNLASWMYWAYANNPTYKFADMGGHLPTDPRLQGLVFDPRFAPEGKNVDLERVEALSRPYLARTAGFPLMMNFTTIKGPRGQSWPIFNCSWSVEGYDGSSDITEIFLPPHVFPNISNVQAVGCEPVECNGSKQDKRWLCCQNLGLTNTVHVAVVQKASTDNSQTVKVEIS